jgi:hypothetical protein
MIGMPPGCGYLRHDMMKTPHIVGMAAVALACALSVAHASEVPVDDDLWTYSESPNPVAGGLTRLAEFVTPRATATVRCAAARFDFEVRFFVAENLIEDLSEVRTQFDQLPAQTTKWTRSPNGRSIVVPWADRDAFIHQLKAFNELTVTLVDSDGEEEPLLFPLNGSAAAIGAVQNLCVSSALSSASRRN